MFPGRMIGQRVARRIEIHILGQLHRQVLVWDRHHAATITVDNRDRASPITLAGDTPVPQPIGCAALTGLRLLQRVNGGTFAGLDGHAVPVA